MLDVLEDRKLLKKNGDGFDEISNVVEKLKGTDMIAYYFGAKWCTDCVKFTPILKDFYNNMKARNESFEVIYVSSDKTEEEMKEFVLDAHGDWFVLYVDENDDESDDFEYIWYIRSYFLLKGIPKLIITKETPDSFPISLSKGVTDILSKGENAVDEWKKKIAENYEEDDDDEEKPVDDDIKPSCCKISKYKPWVSTPPIELLAGINLLRKIDDELKEEPAASVLDGIEIVGFYFSATWCGPCHMFTPELEKCYKELKAENKPFEVIFISSDKSEEDMKQYMQELHGNWYALPFDDKNMNRSLNKKFQVEGIPTLGIVNSKGEWVNQDGVDDVYSKGSKAFDGWIGKEEAAVKSEEEN